jgi:hypothetical protein
MRGFHGPAGGNSVVMTEEFGNPAATADAEQRARQEMAGVRARLLGLARAGAVPLALVAALMAWLILRRRRR